MVTAQRAPTREDWRTLGLLGVPTFAFALAITVVSTYLPVLAESFDASSIVVGLLRVSLVIYAGGLIVPFATTTGWVVALAAPLVAFGGGVTMSLPDALLMPMMPPRAHGALTGFYSLSRGLGVSLGPLLGGVAVQVWGGDFRAVWLVCAVSIALSLPLLRVIADDGR
jgi:MFS-type transporter involved in bile tolerance (Atg22 family)